MSTVATFIKNAISLASRSMSDATAVLLWGDEQTPVTAIKARSMRNQFGRGDSGVINEHQRFVLVCEGLTLPNEYDSIRVDGVRRVVTSVTAGGSEVNANIGTSAPFDKTAAFSIKFDDQSSNLVKELTLSVPALLIGGPSFDTLSGALTRSTDDRVKVAVSLTDWAAALAAQSITSDVFPNTGALVTLSGDDATARVVEWSWIGNTMLVTLRAGRDY